MLFFRKRNKKTEKKIEIIIILIMAFKTLLITIIQSSIRSH